MANNATRLVVTDLEFDQIKTNLINFLKSQDQFKDYNFEGSGMNILMDILAYNLHYHGFYTNMAYNESTVDSALLKDNLVSKAKELGYLPRSRSGARAIVDFTVTPNGADTSTSATLPKFTKFLSSAVNGTNFIFTTLESVVATRANTSASYVFSDLEIVQGRPLTYTFPVVSLADNPTLMFELPDVGIDIDTLQVSVQQSSSNLSSEIYTLADDITEVEPESAIYYLQAAPGDKYKIQFGDDILGKKLQDGNIVIVTYLVTDGELANEANNFTYYGGSGFTSGATFSTSTTSRASGGASEEDIESIRFNALNGYGAQNRAVTDIDYSTLLKQDYPHVDAIAVWGGQDNDPPVYGTVFISLKPKLGFTLSAAEKDRILREIVSKRNVLTVTPRIIDPDFTYVRCMPTVRYDSRKTDLSEDSLKNIARSAILGYTETSLGNFSSPFRLSQFLSNITVADPCFINVDMDVILEKRLVIVPQVSRSYQVDFGCELRRGSSTSKIYMTPSFTVLDGFGIARQAYIEESPLSSSGIDSIVIDNAGSEYTNPTIEIVGDAPANTVATAVATVVNGKIETITLTDRGEGYSFASVNISDPTGIDANASAIISSQIGTLRSYYFSDGRKIILNENAGTIFYNNGSIILENFFPTSIEGDVGSNEVKIIAKSEKDTVAPLRNNIITIDDTDPTSISITMVKEL